jgi:hypothetical protein
MLGTIGAVSMVAAGCGDDPIEVEDDQGQGGTGAGMTSTTTTVPVVSTSTGMGGMGSDGNDSFDEARQLDLNMEIQDQIDSTTDVDYFVFTVAQEESLLIFLDAKPDNDPFADGYVDTVVTLYDSNQQQIAEDDGPIPRNTK